MATVYQLEDTVGDGVTVNGVQFLSATHVNRVVFNPPAVTLTTTAFTTAIYNNTAGNALSSGTGKIVFDNAFHNSTVAIVDNDDRFGWATVVLSGVSQTTLSLSAVGYSEAQGPTERRLRVLGYM